MSDIGFSYISGLTTVRLESLLNPAAPKDDKAVDILQANAASGDAASIELLINLAARPDLTGKQAENVLFDLFSGKPDPQAGIHAIGPDVASEIARQSLKMFESYTTLKVLPYVPKAQLTSPADAFFTSSSDKEPANKLANTSKLLYMAGAATQPGSDSRTRIAATFIGDKPDGKSETLMHDVFPESPRTGKRDDPWDMARFVDASELKYAVESAAASNSLAKPSVSLCGPYNMKTLLATTSDGTQLQIDTLKSALNNGQELLFVPLQHNNHWLSLVIYKDEKDDDKPKAVLFDSIGGYYKDPTTPADTTIPGIEHELVPALGKLGIAKADITPLEANLQGNAPNSCGVYTVEAFKRLSSAASVGISPAKALGDLIANFDKNPDAQQRLNIEGRRQIHGTLIDAAHSDIENPSRRPDGD